MTDPPDCSRWPCLATVSASWRRLRRAAANRPGGCYRPCQPARPGRTYYDGDRSAEPLRRAEPAVPAALHLADEHHRPLISGQPLGCWRITSPAWRSRASAHVPPSGARLGLSQVSGPVPAFRSSTVVALDHAASSTRSRRCQPLAGVADGPLQPAVVGPLAPGRKVKDLNGRHRGSPDISTIAASGPRDGGPGVDGPL